MGTPKTKKTKVTQPSLASFLLPASKPSQTVPSPLVMSEEDQEPQKEQEPLELITMASMKIIWQLIR